LKVGTTQWLGEWLRSLVVVWVAFVALQAARADFADLNFNLAEQIARLLPQGELARAMEKVRQADQLRAQNKLEDAVAASAEAVAFGANLPVAQAIHGHILRRVGLLDLSARHLQRAVELQPDYLGAWQELGMVQLMRNNAGGALAAGDKLVSLQPRDASAHAVRGAALLLKKNTDGAMEEFATAIGLDKNYAYSYEGRAAAYEAQGETKSALVDLDRAYALTREPSLLLRRAALKIKRHDLDGAMEDYNIALKANLQPPMRAQVHLARAQIYDEWKQKDRATEDRRAAAAVLGVPSVIMQPPPAGSGLRPPPLPGAPVAITIPPDVQRALQLFQQAVVNMQRGHGAEAMTQFDQVLKLAPAFAEAWANRGILRVNVGRTAEAISDFDQAIKLGLDSPMLRAHRGLAAALKGDLVAAVADFDRALKAEQNQPQWLAWRANCLRRLNRLDDARRDLDLALKLDPKSAPACEERARVLAIKGALMESLADADKLVELQPKYAGAWLLRGAIQHQIGNLQAALADLDKAVELAPNFPLAYQERSIVLQKLNRPDLAQRDLQKVGELTKPAGK
jgi:tetratricopeptide (TPR) repeat protein